MRHIRAQSMEFSELNVELGYRYASNAIVADGMLQPPSVDPIRVYEPSTRPGSPLPHAWIDDAHGHRRAIRDLLAPATFLGGAHRGRGGRGRAAPPHASSPTPPPCRWRRCGSGTSTATCLRPALYPGGATYILARSGRAARSGAARPLRRLAQHRLGRRSGRGARHGTREGAGAPARSGPYPPRSACPPARWRHSAGSLHYRGGRVSVPVPAPQGSLDRRVGAGAAAGPGPRRRGWWTSRTARGRCASCSAARAPTSPR